MQTVVAAAPRLPNTPTLEDGGVYAARPQCRRGSQFSRTSADDDDIVQASRLLLTALYAAQVTSYDREVEASSRCFHQ
jgi:hypothetical protein